MEHQHGCDKDNNDVNGSFGDIPLPDNSTTPSKADTKTKHGAKQAPTKKIRIKFFPAKPFRFGRHDNLKCRVCQANKALGVSFDTLLQQGYIMEEISDLIRTGGVMAHPCNEDLESDTYLPWMKIPLMRWLIDGEMNSEASLSYILLLQETLMIISVTISSINETLMQSCTSK